MKIVIKGLNYTEVRYIRKDSWKETVMFWKLSKDRDAKDCGVWITGKQSMTYVDMADEGVPTMKLPSAGNIRSELKR